MGSSKLETKYFAQGGVHTLYVSGGDPELGHEPVLRDYLLTSENTVHMMWLLPQYIVITVGEIIFSITGLEFSYSQAPESMKSVLQAAWLLTVAFGNLIVIVIAKAKFFDDQASEFFMFAGLMFLDMLFFAFIAYFYKYVDVAALERQRKEAQSGSSNNNNSSSDNMRLENRKGIENQGYSGSTEF